MFVQGEKEVGDFYDFDGKTHVCNLVFLNKFIEFQPDYQ